GTPGAGRGEDGNERREVVLAGRVDLGVDPLDLERARHVGVDVEAAARSELAALEEAADLAAVVAGEPAVVGAALAIHQVELDAEHGLGPADGELEVGPEARAGVPLAVAVPRIIGIVEVAAHRGDLIEDPGD